MGSSAWLAELSERPCIGPRLIEGTDSALRAGGRPVGTSSPDWEGAPASARCLVGVGRWSADPQTQSLGQVAALARLGQVMRGGMEN